MASFSTRQRWNLRNSVLHLCKLLSQFPKKSIRGNPTVLYRRDWIARPAESSRNNFTM